MAQIIISQPEDLQKVIEAENDELEQQGYGAKFRVQPLPQPGQGCRERFLIWHSYSNGVPISKTEVSIALDGQIRAFHPKFKWEVGEVEERRTCGSCSRRYSTRISAMLADADNERHKLQGIDRAG